MTHTPRKRFGQHFLIDETIIEKIVYAINPKPTDALVEIGPGQGAITTHILKRIAPIHVVEVDRDLCRQLERQFEDKIILHEGDALKFDFASLYDQQKLRIIGNLPYNISTPLLFHLINFDNVIEDMVFMLQKEVVDRMQASPSSKDYGRLSVMLQYALEVKALFNVPATAFSPPPKVISSIVYLKPYGSSRPHPLAQDEKHLSHIVNLAFQQRRKTLRNSLGTHFSREAFEKVDIDLQRRPETLSVAEFVQLSNQLLETREAE